MRNQQIALVQCYIHHLKDVEVNIAFPHSLRDKQLLYKAATIAQTYLNK